MFYSICVYVVLCDRAVILNSLLPVISKISSELIVSVSFMEVATDIIRFIAFTVIRWHYCCFSIVVSYYSLVLAPAFGSLFVLFPFFLFPHQWFVLIFIFVPLVFFFFWCVEKLSLVFLMWLLIGTFLLLKFFLTQNIIGSDCLSWWSSFWKGISLCV